MSDEYDGRQPLPIANETTPIVDLVIEDLLERKEHGIRKYGAPLQVNNGRDMTLDLYDELIDASVYIRGLIEENKQKSVSPESEAVIKYLQSQLESRTTQLQHVRETVKHLSRRVVELEEYIEARDSVTE